MQLPVFEIRSPRPLVDRHRRSVAYLRLSLTKACAMRCTYCRPQRIVSTRGEPTLTAAELERLVRHLVQSAGVRKVRLTGGDPTSRADLIEIVSRLARIRGIEDLAMTTNGLTLTRQAALLREAGLARINVSLDALDRQLFADITGVDGLDRVLSGIDAAQRAGLSPVKINCVVVGGTNDDRLGEMVTFAADRHLEVRFIEMMPMGPLAASWSRRYVSAATMRLRMADTVAAWRGVSAAPGPGEHAAARRYEARLRDGRVARVGFVSPMSDHFCDGCNRLRITASGDIYPCLMDEPRGNLLNAAQAGDMAAVDEALDAAFARKQATHPEVGHAVMTHIGG